MLSVFSAFSLLHEQTWLSYECFYGSTRATQVGNIESFCKPQLSHEPHTALALDQYFFHGDASIYLQPHTAQRQPCNRQETFVLHLLHTLLNMNLMTNIGFDIRQPIIQQLGTLENVTSRYNQPSLDFIGQELTSMSLRIFLKASSSTREEEEEKYFMCQSIILTNS